MAKEADKRERRICLVSTDNVQNLAFLELLGERTGVECVIRRELRRTAMSAALAEYHTLILVDCLFINPDSVVQQIEQLPNALPPNVMVAMINVYSDSAIELRAVTRGIRGLFDTAASVEHVLRGIEALYNGDVWIPRKVLVNAAFSRQETPSAKKPNHGAGMLTRREREILTLLATGASNDMIADQMNISPNTVRTHIYNLYRKIDVPNRMQAVLWSAENL